MENRTWLATFQSILINEWIEAGLVKDILIQFMCLPGSVKSSNLRAMDNVFMISQQNCFYTFASKVLGLDPVLV